MEFILMLPFCTIFMVMLNIYPSLSIMQCPGGVRTFSAYPDDGIDDPAYYYDCTKTKFALLKKCKPGQFYDGPSSKCMHLPKYFKRGRDYDEVDAPPPADAVGEPDGNENVLPPAQNINSLTEVTAEDITAFLKHRGKDKKRKQPALGFLYSNRKKSNKLCYVLCLKVRIQN